MTQVILGNDTKVLYSHDDANRLTKVENRKSDNSLILSFEYLLDAVGNRLKMTEANGDYTEYGYDNVYQLLSEVKKNSLGSTLYSYAYTYDNVGNRLTMTRDGQLTSYTYDVNNRLLTAGVISFGYDANGNTISQTGPTTYQYDYENHLTKIIYPDGSKNWFGYDGDGIRQSKRDTVSVSRFIYDDLDILQEISKVTGLTSVEYLHGSTGLLKQRRNNLDSWYQFDGLGSTRALTDSGQAVTDTYSYDAFGNTLAITGSTVNPYKYVGGWGYYADLESDSMLLTMRYYDPSIGRFTSRDPVAGRKSNPQTLNPYVYCVNNPLAVVDPSGMTPEWLRSIIGTGAVMGESMLRGSPISTTAGIAYGIATSCHLPTWDMGENRLVFESAKIPKGYEGAAMGRVKLLDKDSQTSVTPKHEDVHLDDIDRLGGDFWYLLYGLEYLYQRDIKCKHGYWDNRFEVRAYKQELDPGRVKPIWGGRIGIYNLVPLGLITRQPRFGVVIRW